MFGEEVFMLRIKVLLTGVILTIVIVGTVFAQNDDGGTFDARGIPPTPLPEAPVVFDTAEGQRIRVSVVATGLSHPWGLAILPNGDMLVTERQGALRLIRDGVLELDPVPGVPEVFTGVNLSGLMDIQLHPQFGETGFVYLTYSKPTDEGATVALARGRFDGRTMSEVRDIFVADADGSGTAGSRLVFAANGDLYMTVGGAFNRVRELAQDPSSHIGKVLRLKDDGTAATDNPFVGQAGSSAEVFSLGHRNQLGIAVHPETGDIWASENAPLGGDEVNIISSGENYGWPTVSYSREYYGPRIADRPWQEGLVQPELVWIPSIAPSGLMFYTGDRFPAWKGDLFVGSLMTGRVARTGHLERVTFNRQGMEQRREWLLADLKQRIRDVRQGPDGLIYVLTDGAHMFEAADDAAVLRIEPVD
jgi:glucose/arabinose dehydrogenase